MKKLQSYFKMSLKAHNGKPSIQEVSYQGADGNTYTGLQFEGYASTKDRDRTNDVVLPKSFINQLAEYMENSIILLQHNAEKPIGSIIEATVDDKGLYVKGIVKSDKDNIFQDLRTGVIKTMSFGYRVLSGETRTVSDEQGKSHKVYEINQLELFEISLVSVPMNPKAQVKSKDELLGKELSDIEYAKYFQVDKKDEYSIYQSIKDLADENIEDDPKENEEEIPKEEEVPEIIETPEEVIDEPEAVKEEETPEVIENEEEVIPEPVEETPEEEKEEVIEEKKEEIIEEQPKEEEIEVPEEVETPTEEIIPEEEETPKEEEIIPEIKEEEQPIEEEVINNDEEPEEVPEVKSISDLKTKSIDFNNDTKFFDCIVDIKAIDVPDLYKNKIPLGAIYFEGIVSDESVNRYGEKVLSSAFQGQINKFIKNGVVLLGHDSNQPIGLPLWVSINKNNQVEVGGYVFDEYTDGRVSKGLFRGLSIGFIPTERAWEDKETGEMISHKEFIKKLNEAETFEEWFELLDKYMFVITKIDWLEYSFVTTPANKGTTIKLDYVEGKEGFKEMFMQKSLELQSKENEEIETPEVKEETPIETEEEIKKEEEPIETPTDVIPSEIIPENDAGDGIETPTPELTPSPENEEEVPAEVESGDKKMEHITKTISEIQIKVEMTEDLKKGFDLLKSQIKELETDVKKVNELEQTIKSMQDDTAKFKQDTTEVVSQCIEIVKKLSSNFKNYFISSMGEYTDDMKPIDKKEAYPKTKLTDMLEGIKATQ